MALTYREITPADWAAIEALFGEKGACSGCWCMWWRAPQGGKAYRAMSGEPNRQAMQQLVESATALGALAFAGDQPVGWCTFGPRTDFPRIERTRAYQGPDPTGVWSIPCFFIQRQFRGQGVARGLLTVALEAIRQRGGSVVEAYPVPLSLDGKRLPATFAFTGPLSLYEEFGFELVQRTSHSRPLVRMVL